ncbi:hypothetical protein [Micromonospora sp. NPDC057140]
MAELMEITPGRVPSGTEKLPGHIGQHWPGMADLRRPKNSSLTSRQSIAI